MFENLQSLNVLKLSRPAEAVLSLLEESSLTLHLTIRGKMDVITQLNKEASMTLIHKDQWLTDRGNPRD